jgi:hypothetical protein
MVEVDAPGPGVRSKFFNAGCMALAGVLSCVATSATAQECSVPALAAEYVVVQEKQAKCEKNDSLIFCDEVEDFEPEISMRDADKAWQCLANGSLKQAFEGRKAPAVTAFSKWKKYSTAPYHSAHVNRFIDDINAKSIFVMNYANDKAKVYEKYEKAGVFPEGSVLIKYSVLVTAEGGKVEIAPLFIMEKLKIGSRPETGDWRYDMVFPNAEHGTKNLSSAEFSEQICMECHQQYGRETDSVMFVPDDYRIPVE